MGTRSIITIMLYIGMEGLRSSTVEQYFK